MSEENVDRFGKGIEAFTGLDGVRGTLHATGKPE
jgi:hypothetical protein